MIQILKLGGLAKADDLALAQHDLGEGFFQLQAAERAVKLSPGGFGDPLQVVLVKAADDSVALVVFKIDGPFPLVTDRDRRAITRTDADGMNSDALFFDFGDSLVELGAVVLSVG